MLKKDDLLVLDIIKWMGGGGGNEEWEIDKGPRGS